MLIIALINIELSCERMGVLSIASVNFSQMNQFEYEFEFEILELISDLTRARSFLKSFKHEV